MIAIKIKSVMKFIIILFRFLKRTPCCVENLYFSGKRVNSKSNRTELYKVNFVAKIVYKYTRKNTRSFY